MSTRDPFPSPKLETDFSLSGVRPQQRKPYNKPTHLAQTEEPWSRLHDTATLASTQRSVTHYDHQPQVPKDSLDFQLTSVYDHHKNYFWTKNQILYQKQTEDHMKQENLEKQDMLRMEENNGIRMWVDPQRHSIYSMK